MRVAMAGVSYPDAGGEIQVRVALLVVDITPLSTVGDEVCIQLPDGRKIINAAFSHISLILVFEKSFAC